jgi:hypothetical protein
MSIDPETLIDNPPNTGQPVERVWMFVSRDVDGRENVCGALIGEIGMQPLITANPRIHGMHRALAAHLRAAEPETGKTIHLLVFTHREEIEEWR